MKFPHPVSGYFKKMSIKRKLNLIFFLSIFLSTSILFLIVLPILEKSRFEDREGKLKAVVGSVVSLMDYYENAVNNAEYINDQSQPVDIEAAKKLVIKNVSRMRYDQNEYFFILDGGGNVVMHPLRPELVGKNILNEKDNEGNYIFKEMVINSQRDNETIVKYIWKSKYSETVYEPQTVFAQYFWPWDWVVCSGLYTQDIIDSVSRIKLMALVYSLIATMLSMFALFRLLFYSVISPLEKLQGGMQKIQNGNYDVQLLVRAEDEVGFLTKNFNLMVDKINKAEKQLEDYTINLEYKVHQRTEALKNSLEELKTAQDKLVENEKFAFLGGLVAGISHEINTPIGICVTAATHLHDEAQKLKTSFENNSMTKTKFEEHITLLSEISGLIITNTDIASNLISSFKKIAVDQSHEAIRTFNLNDYLKDVFLSLKPQFKKFKNPEIIIDCPDKIVLTTYSSAIYQVLTNLVMNSIIHGFENRDECRISLVISNNNNKIQMLYSDNGNGMTADVIRHIYDPFFTTKRGSGGSGLGMNIVYNIVMHKLKGTIKCESSPGNGVQFNIHFPAVLEIKE